MKKKKVIIYLILMIFCMVIIFLFSNQVSDNSNNFSRKIIENVILIIDNIYNVKCDKLEIINMLNYPIRKLAHFTIFFILGFCTYGFFKSINLKNGIIFSVLICLFYAGFDEIHQLFILNRTSSIFDVLIDVSGSLFLWQSLKKIKILTDTWNYFKYQFFNVFKI